MANPMRIRSNKSRLALIAALSFLVVACVLDRPGSGELHRWWSGLGPVLPHDTFPGDCKLCHVGKGWNDLTEDFQFDHKKETGVPLNGAHGRAKCLRCHNDRGPVAVFQAKGCAGCHEDYHYGELGRECTSCHGEQTWRPQGQIARHYRTRFPLTGAHASVACHRCHPGSRVGNFLPTNPECLSCHRDEINNANNPPHIPLGYVNNCDRCHMPTFWNQTR